MLLRGIKYVFPLLRSSRSFFTRLNPPLPPPPPPPPPSSWESALVIYNLEPFHFLCNYETADNPARFIIHEAADVPHFSSLPPLPLPSSSLSPFYKVEHAKTPSKSRASSLREEDYHLVGGCKKQAAVRWDTGDTHREEDLLLFCH